MNIIKNYFKNHNRLLSNSFTFKELMGMNSYLEHPLFIRENQSLEESKILDKSPLNQSKTENKLKKIISKLYNTHRNNITIQKRSVMYTGHNYPLKIEFKIQNKLRKICYIKPQGFVRALSIEFYNILSGNKSLDYEVGNNVIVQKEQPGELKKRVEENILLGSNTTYLENLIRLNTFSEMISLTDLINPHNINIDKEFNLHPVDFEDSFKCLKYKCLYNQEVNILNLPYLEIIDDEINNILKRINDNKDKFRNLVSVLKKSDFINENFVSYTYKNPGEFIDHMVKEYRNK